LLPLDLDIERLNPSVWLAGAEISVAEKHSEQAFRAAFADMSDPKSGFGGAGAKF